MVMKKITSLQLHLNYPAEQVVETKCLEDVGCGIYPCYFMKLKDKLKVSTSVTALIFDSKIFELNPTFNPPDFLKQTSKQNSLHKKLSLITPTILKRVVKYFDLRLLSDNLHKDKFWYESWETIDKRVKKLRPFEKVTPRDTTIKFKPDFTIRDKEIIINKTVNYLQKFVQSVEREFPDYEHIIMTGGKDSQLINLIPKLNSEKWHIFSAEPNYTLVKKWIEKNDVTVNKIFKHNNQNEESFEDFKKKILCSDLYADLRHMRWIPTLKRIAKEFDYKCIFWSGTAADAIYSFHKDFHNKFKEEYFKVHMIRVGTFQGNYHQICKNFVGCPTLSPYHSKEIWEELYQHLDPSIITKDTDLRKEIGEKLFGRPVKWSEQNPSPEPYSYSFHFDSYKFYVEYIKKGLTKNV